MSLQQRVPQLVTVGRKVALAFGVVALGACQTSCAGTESAPAPRIAVEASFSDTGLSGLKCGGTELLADGQFRVQRVAFDEPDGNTANGDVKNPSASFDRATMTHAAKFSWGAVSCRYGPRADRLDLAVTVENTSQEPIGLVSLSLMDVRFPQLPKGLNWEKGWPVSQNNMGSPTVVSADCNDLVMIVCNEDIDRPLTVAFNVRKVKDKENLYNLSLTAGGAAIVYDRVTNARPIPPGKTDTYNLSLRFGPPGARPTDIAEDLCRKFAAAHPPVLKWADRRPINRVILCQTVAPIPKNPRRWFGDRNLDVTTDEGRAKFREMLLKRADAIVSICKDSDAQGIIVWDIEGEEHDKITYVGDPNSVPVLAPEMDAVADEFFKRFADAGLRTGVCIRPTFIASKIDPNTKLPVYVHAYGLEPDVIGRLSDKIAYAKKRWGCSLFYVDTNAIWRPGKDGKYAPAMMTAEQFRKIMERHGDVLIVPEHEYTEYWGCTAPYNELRMNVAGTPSVARKVYPRGFSVISVDDGDFDKYHDALVRSVREGDVLMFNGWYRNKAIDRVKEIVREAKGAVGK